MCAFCEYGAECFKTAPRRSGSVSLALVLQFRDTAAAKLSSFRVLERVLRDQFEAR